MSRWWKKMDPELGDDLCPSTFTCLYCNLTIEVRHRDKPFLRANDTRLLCEHMRSAESLRRIEGLRQGTPDIYIPDIYI